MNSIRRKQEMENNGSTVVSFIEYPFTVFEKVIVPSKRREGKVIVTNINIYRKNMLCSAE
jgi:hypothetical protein